MSIYVILTEKLFNNIFFYLANDFSSNKNALKMLCLYLLGQHCLHLTFKPYVSSETYSLKYEKLPNVVIHACKILHKEGIC